MPETSILNKSATEQVKYAEVNLKKIASGFAKLAKNPEFVNFVHHEAARKFDGEYETLIEHLKRNPTWGSLLNTEEINEGLAAFKNLNGNNFYPQVYIPKMQHDEENHIPNFLSNNNSNLVEDLKVVIYGGDQATSTSTNDEYPGYLVDIDGDLIEWNDIGEAYADSNLVWIFSLNEVIDAQGRLSMPTSPVCSDPLDPECYGGGGGGSGSTVDFDPIENFLPPHPAINDGTRNPVNCKIEKMTVMVRYEHWAAGKSEVSIKAKLNCHNNLENGGLNAANQQYRSDQYSNNLGKLIRKFTKSEIRDHDEIVLNYTLQTGWPSLDPLTDPIFFDYSIFERDNWPVGVREISMGKRKDFLQNNLTESGYYANYCRAGIEGLPFGYVSNSLYSKGAITNTLYNFPNNSNFTMAPYNSNIKTIFYNGGLDNGAVINPVQVGPLINFNTKAF